MNTPLHANNATGLEDLDPAVTPTQDAPCFRTTMNVSHRLCILKIP